MNNNNELIREINRVIDILGDVTCSYEVDSKTIGYAQGLLKLLSIVLENAVVKIEVVNNNEL